VATSIIATMTTKIWTKLAESGTFLLLLHAGKPGRETAAMTKKMMTMMGTTTTTTAVRRAETGGKTQAAHRQPTRALVAAFLLGSAQQQQAMGTAEEEGAVTCSLGLGCCSRVLSLIFTPTPQ
jgi:hypothetical protein